VKLLKVKAWWKKALDRDIWGRIYKEAKVRKGLQSQKKKFQFGLLCQQSVMVRAVVEC
jgi:hypothetical protein